MKKRFSVVTAIVLTACFLVLPFAGLCVSAEDGEKPGKVIYSQNFESFPAAEEASEAVVFNDAKGNKPEGFTAFVGDGERSGAIIGGGQIGGSKSLRLMRYDGGVANMRITGLSLGAFGEGSEIDFSFTFRYKTLGNYGFSVLLAGIPESPSVEDYGGGTRNIFSSGTDDESGKDVLYVVNPEGGSLAAADFLKPDTDYNVKTVFKLGSDEYSLYINGELVGNYKYIGDLTNITAIRFDCHDWAEENDISRSQPGSSHVNEVYFDDISLVAFGSGEPSVIDNKLYKFNDDDFCFFEEFELLDTADDYEQPNTESDTFNFIDELPFLKSDMKPFVNRLAYVMPTDADGDFDGIALAAKDFLDMRFWMISSADDPDADIYVSFKIKVKELTGCFDLCVTNITDGPTSTDSTDRGGMVLKLEPSNDGKVSVVNTSGQALCSFEKDKTVTVGAAFFNGTKNYVVMLDGKMVKGSLSYYPEEFNGVQALRLDLDGTGGEVIFDDIYIEYGSLSEIKDPSETTLPETSAPAETPTEEATEVPSEPAETTEVTKEPDPTAGEVPTEQPESKPAGKKGCGGYLASGALAAALAVSILALKKKKK